MSAQMWYIIAIVGFSLAGVALVTAVIMFFKMNIPAVIGDLSGKTVAREIKAMRSASLAAGKAPSTEERKTDGKPLEIPKQATAERAAAMAVVHASKRLDTASGKSAQIARVAQPAGKQPNSTELLPQDNQTEILTDSPKTDVLAESAKTDILAEAPKTDILTEAPKTDILTDAPKTDILTDAPKTDILTDAPKTDILTQAPQTEVLAAVPAKGGTGILAQPEDIEPEPAAPVGFVVTRSVVRIHTDEVIG